MRSKKCEKGRRGAARRRRVHCRHVNLSRDQQFVVIGVLHAGIEHGCNFKQFLHSVAVSLVHAFRVDLDAALAEHYDLRLLHKLNGNVLKPEGPIRHLLLSWCKTRAGK